MSKILETNCVGRVFFDFRNYILAASVAFGFLAIGLLFERSSGGSEAVQFSLDRDDQVLIDGQLFITLQVANVSKNSVSILGLNEC